jgi:hypothetical protein
MLGGSLELTHQPPLLKPKKHSIFRRIAVKMLRLLPYKWLVDSITERFDVYLIFVMNEEEKTPIVGGKMDGGYTYNGTASFYYQATPTQYFVAVDEMTKQVAEAHKVKMKDAPPLGVGPDAQEDV